MLLKSLQDFKKLKGAYCSLKSVLLKSKILTSYPFKTFGFNKPKGAYCSFQIEDLNQPFFNKPYKPSENHTAFWFYVVKPQAFGETWFYYVKLRICYSFQILNLVALTKEYYGLFYAPTKGAYCYSLLSSI